MLPYAKAEIFKVCHFQRSLLRVALCDHQISEIIPSWFVGKLAYTIH